MRVKSLQGENIDDVVYRVMGSSNLLEETLILNYDLCDYTILPMGTEVIIPDYDFIKEEDYIDLWNN